MLRHGGVKDMWQMMHMCMHAYVYAQEEDREEKKKGTEEKEEEEVDGKRCGDDE